MPAIIYCIIIISLHLADKHGNKTEDYGRKNGSYTVISDIPTFWDPSACAKRIAVPGAVATFLHATRVDNRNPVREVYYIIL